jgi:hypothetical protein
MGIFGDGPFVDGGKANTRHRGSVERIAFSTSVGGGMGMGAYSTTICHLLLKDEGSGVVSDIIAFDSNGASAIHLTQIGDRVLVEVTDECEYVHFENQTTGLTVTGD